jgi:TolB-like protein
MELGTTAKTYQIGDFTVDAQSGMLLCNKQTIFLRPKAQTLFNHLAQNIGRVVSKAELMDAAWPGIFVTEDSLTQSIREIRRTLGDESQTLIRTISKRGYLLATNPEEVDDGAAQPIVAVLRFRNESGDESQTPIVDGFGEDIINGLARFGRVTVLARHSSYAVSSSGSVDWATARSRIGADYLVEGSMRRADKKVRVTVNLIDAEKLTQIWGDHYEAEGSSIFDIQNDIVERIIGRLVYRIEDEGISKALRKPETDLVAYELVLRGLTLMRSNDPAEFENACALLEAAVAKDPSYGLAHAELAFAKVMRSGFGRSSPKDLDKSLEIAARAVKLSPDQPTAHRVLSFVQMYRGEHTAAEQHLRRALELNQYDAESTEQMGYLLTLRGRPTEALTWMNRAVKLNPVHPPWYEHDRAFALYTLGDYKGAAESIELTPIPPAWMLTWLAACYAQMGELELARQHVSRVTETDPNFSAVNFARRNGAAFEHASDNEHFAEGVFMALGIPIQEPTQT